MKKIPILILFLMTIPLLSYAFQNEPDGFRGIKWGTNLKDVPNMAKTTGEGDEYLYVRKKDKLQIGDAYLTSIHYGFYKKQFYTVWIRFNSLSNFQKLRETLSQQYGTGNKPNQFMDDYDWLGANIFISLKYNSITERGSILYIYLPIREEKRKDDEEKAKKASDDL